MAKLSRRHLVTAGIAGAGASVLPGFVDEAYAAPQTRFNLSSPNGQVMLKKYAKAVELMMALPASNPLSWTFQWYTHAVPTNTTKAAAITSIFGAGASPQKALAQAMWNTCQAHFNAADEPYFLPWHRMYVCFFESIIRAVLKDKTFTLPYWNYTAVSGYPLPKEFRMQNDPTWGPLFRPNRRVVTNAGQPIFTGMGTATDLNPASALAQPTYLPAGVQPGFNQALDQGVHGNVHVFVGNGQGMGSIPWAANDPVFWMHHCNIDRVWVSWNASGHINPGTVAWLNKVFVFADSNGQGARAIVKDYTNTVKCNYNYDALYRAPVVARAPLAMLALAPAAPKVAAPETVASMAQPGTVALGASPVTINLRAAPAAPAAPGAPAAPAAPSAASPLAAKIAALPDDHRLYLVIGNVKADAQPETLFRVYLDLPDGPPSDPINSNYVGSFNFFDAVPHGDDHAGHAAKPVTFDVTTVAANLSSLGLLKKEHTVTIVAANEPTGNSKPVVGDISFVEQ
jgi:tyrosinase